MDFCRNCYRIIKSGEKLISFEEMTICVDCYLEPYKKRIKDNKVILERLHECYNYAKSEIVALQRMNMFIKMRMRNIELKKDEP